MKKILAILLMMPVIAFSQPDEVIKKIDTFCLNVNGLDKLLVEFEELPFVRGLSQRESGAVSTQNSLVVFMNIKTRTWSIVEKTSDGLYCFLAVGQDFEPVPAEVIEKLQKERQKSRS